MSRSIETESSNRGLKRRIAQAGAVALAVPAALGFGIHEVSADQPVSKYAGKFQPKSMTPVGSDIFQYSKILQPDANGNYNDPTISVGTSPLAPDPIGYEPNI